MLNIEFHLNELKYRFVYILFSVFITFLFSYLHVKILMYLLAEPFLRHQSKRLYIFETDFIFTNIFEAFSSYITISFIVTIYIMLPFCSYIIFGFVQVGLFFYEKNLINIVFITITVLSLFSFFFYIIYFYHQF
jgi:Sec-independent protein secretion pathway component TatC